MQSSQAHVFGQAPTQLDEVFHPLEDASQPPSDIYTSQSWYEEERKALFLQAWHFVCLASDLAESGEYKMREFVGTPVIVVQGEDGSLRAFYNTCRHRGAPLTNCEAGKVKNFVCPFHRWSYRLDGTLFRAPGYEEKAGFDVTSLNANLVELPCETRENLVFIHLNTEPALDLDSFLGDYIDTVARPHAISAMRSVHHRRYHLTANWKLYAEVDMETLHTPHVHRRSIGEQPVEIPAPTEQWIGVFNRAPQTVALAPDRKDKALPFNPEAYGSGIEGTHFSILFPGFFIVTAQDCMWWIQKTPVSAREVEVEVDVGYAFPEGIIDTDAYKQSFPYYKERLDQVIQEDDDIVVYQQRGLNPAVSGRYTPRESVVHELAKTLISKTLDGGLSAHRTGL